MSARDPGFDAYVLQIHQVLDQLDYYRLLGVEPSTGASQVKKSFYAIAARFHPDRNRDAPEQVRDAIYDIYKRINEAYQVLSDPERRKLYDQQLAGGSSRFDSTVRMTTVPKTPEDTIKSREARQFFRQASEALKAGNLMQAELHSKVAAAREPGNAAIISLQAQVQAAKAAAKQKKG